MLSLVASSQRVAVVRVVDPNVLVTLSGKQGRRAVIRASLREVIKGSGGSGDALQFASHGHGVAAYAAGDEAIVFLVPLARSPEIAALSEAGVGWVSLQEHDSRYLLAAPSTDALLAAVRRYAAAEEHEAPDVRVEALRRVTLDLLTSGSADLAASAVRDLAAAGSMPLVRREDVPRLLAEVVRSPITSISVRVGLLVALDAHDLVEAPPEWAGLLRTTSGSDLAHVVRAAGRHPSVEVNPILIELLAGDAAVAEAAALALADPAHAAAVPALAGALERDEPRVCRASIRALGRIGTLAALDALNLAASTHASADIRRRAAAEARRPTVAR